MPTFYFTFGQAHQLSGRVQPIIAPTYEQAEELMFQKYGANWAFGYFKDEFDNSTFIKDLKQLTVIKFKEVV